MDGDDPKVPPLWLEKLALNELDAVERLRVEARLGPAERAAVTAKLAADGAEFLRLSPPAARVAEIRRRAQAEPAGRVARRYRPLFTSALAVAATAALALVVWHKTQRGTGAGNEFVPADAALEEMTVKGLPPLLKIYRKTATGYVALADAGAARPGDLLQLRYVAVGARYGAIVSLDGRGEVTLHFPATADAPAALTQGGEVSLDHSFELDDAPAYERFFFVTSATPLDVHAVLDAARQLAGRAAAATDPLPVPGAAKQTSLLVRKIQ